MNRKSISFTALIILFLFLSSGCVKNLSSNQDNHQIIKSGEDITLYTITDLHYLSDHLNDHGEAFQTYQSLGDGKQLEYIDEILYAFQNHMTTNKPDILIISGDLTNNGEQMSHLDLAEFLQKVEENGTSVYVIPGNHDINNPWARGFRANKQYLTDSISSKEFRKIYEDFGYSEAISRDKNSLSYLATPSEDLWLLMLDTNQYQNNSSLGYPETHGSLSSKTLDWIQKCSRLAKKEGAAMITIMHHNIMDHSEVFRDGFTLDHQEETLKLLRDNTVPLVLSGHIHIQDIHVDRRKLAPFYEIVTGALSVHPHQYGILTYTSHDNSLHYQTNKIDVEAWADENNVTDENLKNFFSYSEDYFGNFAYHMAYDILIQDQTLSANEVHLMSEIMKLLNLRYFAGTENLNSEDLIHSKGYQLLNSYQDGFLKSYVDSITVDTDTEDNELKITITGK